MHEKFFFSNLCVFKNIFSEHHIHDLVFNTFFTKFLFFFLIKILIQLLNEKFSNLQSNCQIQFKVHAMSFNIFHSPWKLIFSKLIFFVN
jgi:hypothetical protein